MSTLSSPIPVPNATVVTTSGNLYIKIDSDSGGSDMIPLWTRDDRVITVLNNIECGLQNLGQKLDIIFDIE